MTPFTTHLRRTCLPALLLALATVGSAWGDPPAETSVVRVGSELDFRPYCFTDKDGQPTGFGVDLLRAVADRMGLSLRITPSPWDKAWSALVAGNLDVLPVVARTPGREPLVDFSLPHTETFDAFFVREGRPPFKNLAAATGKEIVVLREDAAHHQLVERKFAGKIIPVGSIPDGMRLIAAGQHDALLCSKMIGVLECSQAGIQGVTTGPPIPDYKRVFSFAVRKGNTELVEELNEGLLIVKTDGTYDRIYRRWLTGEDLWRKWAPYFQWAVATAAVLAGLVIVLQWLVRRRTRQLRELNATIEARIAERTKTLAERGDELQLILNTTPALIFYKDRENRLVRVSRAFAETMGRPKEQLEGRSLFDLYPREQAEAFWRDDQAVMASGRPKLNIVEPMQAAAEERWVQTGKVPCRDAAGNIVGVIGFAVDITERRLAEQELERTRNMLEEAQKIAHLGSFEYVAATQTTVWSVEECRIYGLDPAGPSPAYDVMLAQCIHPDDAVRLHETFTQAMQSRSTYELEHRIVRPDGSVRWVHDRAHPYFDETGALVRYCGATLDITERKAAEEALRASEGRMRHIAQAGRIGFVEWNVAKGASYWSPEHYELFGFEPGSPVSWERWRQGLHPEDQERVLANAARLLERGRAEGQVRGHRDEYRFIRPDGCIVWIEADMSADMVGGELIVRGAVRDITERRQAEAALAKAHRQIQSIIDNTPAIVYALDLEERFVMANTALAKVLHCTPEQLIGKRRHEFMPKEDADGHEANDRQVIEAGKAMELEEYSQLPGRSITWLTTKFPLRDAQNRIYAVAGISADITVRKQAEEALRASNEELARFNRAMVDRELRMIELKKEVNDLCAKAGLPEKYAVKFD